MAVLTYLIFPPCDVRGGILLFGAVVKDGAVEGLVAEDGAVKFVFGEAAEVIADFFGGDVVGFV